MIDSFNWISVQIGDIADVIAGGTPNANDPSNFAEPGEGIAWLDNSTERLLRLRRKFSEKESLSQIQQNRLKKIDIAIEKLGFTTAHWDEEYALYLRMKKQAAHEDDQSIDTPDLNRLRKQRATEIVKRILAAEQQGEHK